MAVTVTHVDITSPNMTETSTTNFIPTGNWVSKRHEGLVVQGQTTLVAEYNVSCSSGNYLVATPNNEGVHVYYVVRLANAAWEPYYSWTVTDTYYTASGQTGFIQASNVKIFYTPPIGVIELDPDPLPPEGGFASHLHDIRFDYEERPIVTANNKLMLVTLSKPTVSPGENQTLGFQSNGVGNFVVCIKKLTAGTPPADYSHSYNFSNDTWVAKASGLQTKTITFNTETVKSGIQEIVTLPSTVETKVYSVVCTAGTLGLNSNIPDAINELTFQTVQSVRATFEPDTKTGVTVAGGFNTTYKPELTFSEKRYPFTFVYTKSGDGTLALTRQPVESDITGNEFIGSITGAIGSGVSIIPMSNTEGFKVNQKVLDFNFEKGLRESNRIPEGSIIGAINSNVSITIKNVTTGTYSAGQGMTAVDAETIGLGKEKLIISSDWVYSFENLEATINTGATAVTATGVLIVHKHGSTSPNGDIKLEPNFLTIS